MKDLIKWIDNEINEWKMFKKTCVDKLKNKNSQKTDKKTRKIKALIKSGNYIIDVNGKIRKQRSEFKIKK